MSINSQVISFRNQNSAKWRNIMPIPKIHVCASTGDVAGVKKELDAGVDVNLLDELQDTPLYIACDGGHIEVVKLFLQRNANIYLKNLHLNTMLLNALIALKVNIKKSSCDDEKAALQERYFEVCKLLLQHEFKIRKENPEMYKEKLLLLDIENELKMTPRGYLKRNLPDLYERLSKLEGIIFNLEFEKVTSAGKSDVENPVNTITGIPSAVKPRRTNTRKSDGKAFRHEASSSQLPVLQESALSSSAPAASSSVSHGSFWSPLMNAVARVVGGKKQDEATVPLLTKRHSD